MIREKYGRDHPNFDRVSAKGHNYSLWKNLVTIWNDFNMYDFGPLVMGV